MNSFSEWPVYTFTCRIYYFRVWLNSELVTTLNCIHTIWIVCTFSMNFFGIWIRKTCWISVCDRLVSIAAKFWSFLLFNEIPSSKRQELLHLFASSDQPGLHSTDLLNGKKSWFQVFHLNFFYPQTEWLLFDCSWQFQNMVKNHSFSHRIDFNRTTAQSCGRW